MGVGGFKGCRGLGFRFGAGCHLVSPADSAPLPGCPAPPFQVLVKPEVKSSIRDLTGQLSAKALYSDGREGLSKGLQVRAWARAHRC